ncbi:hypothetical protein OXX69_002000 [Metschnikowia pulcherrima]
MGREMHSPSKSPDRKKPRPLSKPRKTYIFQPTNTLAYNPQAARGQSSGANVSRESERNLRINGEGSHDTNSYGRISRPHLLNSEMNDRGANSTASNASPARADACVLTGVPGPKTVRVFDKSTDQQSSDDSFDGVRWRPANSPAQTFARPILSSPLRNAEIPPSKGPPAATLVNEITDSMLTKYAVAMQNTLSQTPRYKRTSSDVIPLSHETSPTLTRSKSFDPRCLPGPKLSEPKPGAPKVAARLTTWIDKFDVQNSGEGEAKSAAKVSPEVSTPEKPVYIDEDTLSSDDDTFLANLQYDSLPPLSQFPRPQQQETGASMQPPALCDSSPLKQVHLPKPTTQNPVRAPEDDSDPFSDDLDIAAIESVLTQPSTASSSFTAGKTESSRLDKQNSEVRSVTPDYRKDEYGAKLSYSRSDFSRFQVQSVFVTTYQVQAFKKKQLILTVVDQNETTSKLVVRGETAELDIKASDVVHVIHTTPENPRLISDTHNLLIWNPDTLVSSTTVADQLDCPRKTVLSKRLSFPGSYSIPLLTGTIVHEIFQLCFLAQKCTREYMESLADLEIKRRLLDIYTLGDVVDELKAKIFTHLPYIHRWFQLYFRKPPAEIPTNKRQQKIRFSVAEVLDIEERVVSPMFGIKGIADVTLKANLQSENSKVQLLLPMEIKTGQPYLSHQAQAALYSLLFKDRYNEDIASFLLVYTSNEGLTTKHDISVPDLKSLVNLRNRISVFLRPGNQDLPDLMRQQKCDRCFVQEGCMTYNYLTEEGTAEQSGLKEGVYDDLTAHLEGRQKYKDFLAYWDYLLSREEEFVSRFDKELWVLSAKEREEGSGKSLGSLVITSCETPSGSNDYLYTFKRREAAGRAFNASQISIYDRVIISDEMGHFALAQGYVRHIDSDSITILSRRQIISTESKTDSFHRAGVLRNSQKISQESADAINFRVDKDEMAYGMGVARYNILNLFLSEGDHSRRRLLVDLQEPTFSKSGHFEIDQTAAHFNECQLSAFEKVSKTNDYSLILGMPGTGKTTVIAYLIKMLVAAKKTVLLTSYTNSAVDNILLKVKEYDIDFLRIGNSSRVHPTIQEYTPGSDKNKVECYSDFQRVYSQPFVVAATCLSVQDPAFSIRNRFDYCIIDEASQVSMPVSLGPIALCDKFIMVGDHYQLPPLVSHPDSKIKTGLSQSLFQILANAHPDSVAELKHQYRMCEEIMLISNKLVYKNRLICGNQHVAEQFLEVPHKEKLALHFSGRNPMNTPWLDSAFQEQNRVVFFDHDLLPGYERAVGENITNPAEVELVRQTVEGLVRCGVEPTKIGVMTLYRSQLKLLHDTFRHMPELEILTADRFQGRDKDCIIISLVRSNRDRRSGDLLKDWRRINVAVTRARSKLIVFGSVATLSNAESVSDFVTLAKREGWVHELPETALRSYHFAKPSLTTPKKKVVANKLGSQSIGRHALVKDLLADMNVTL